MSKFSRIAIGAAQFGMNYGIANETGKISRENAGEILKISLENCVDLIDTASLYGDSETCLGELGIQDFRVTTKLPEVPESATDIELWISTQLKKSLSVMGVDSVYGLLLHRPAQLFGDNGRVIYQALQSMKDCGLVKKIGISIYAPNELDELMNAYCFDIVQAPFNLIDRRLSESGWLNRLKESDIEIHTRSSFLQGLLLMEYQKIPSSFSKWSPLWREWQNWLKNNDKKALEVALSFPLSFPEVDRIIVGVDSINQLREILAIADDGVVRNFPEIQCNDEMLINPSFWRGL